MNTERVTVNPEAGRSPARMDDETARVLELVASAATDKLARDPVALDVRDVTALTDVIYICHGDSGRAVDAITQEVCKRLGAAGVDTSHVEGLGQQQWVLLDLGSVMVHVFLRERREYYNLERLWHDARRIDVGDR